MGAKGMGGLGELHERFLEQGSECIGNACWTFERFLKHATNEAVRLHAKFMVPLRGALEATDEEQAGLVLAWVGWDPPAGS